MVEINVERWFSLVCVHVLFHLTSYQLIFVLCYVTEMSKLKKYPLLCVCKFLCGFGTLMLHGSAKRQWWMSERKWRNSLSHLSPIYKCIKGLNINEIRTLSKITNSSRHSTNVNISAVQGVDSSWFENFQSFTTSTWCYADPKGDSNLLRTSAKSTTSTWHYTEPK